ncbi:retrovirus-related Pol polyprotein from transposon opus [Nephila pilipes]|uniref:Retrovirus-related Pol polyprotein from transposon opus n=1 Tax=Nephila pilipes TaxID=299642 RepID=A0A8X6JQG3_NEPPI|nr:retrovirus-related Pol polyprotein from transposon opus [Nephila pilipes]
MNSKVGNLLKSLFLQRLPTHMQQILAISNDQLKKLAQMADANGTVISTYGQRLLNLDLGLRRLFRWPFIIDVVYQPVIRVDFFRHYGLIVDIRHECLLTSLTKFQTWVTVQQWNNSGIKAVNGNTKFHQLLTEFHSLFEAVSIPRQLKYNVTHSILTRGPPIFSKTTTYEQAKNSKT